MVRAIKGNYLRDFEKVKDESFLFTIFLYVFYLEI